MVPRKANFDKFRLIKRKMTVINRNVFPVLAGTSNYDGWSSWSSWGLCSSSCGQGKQHRYRFCTSVSTSMDKASTCAGKALMSRSCALNPCPGIKIDLLYFNACLILAIAFPWWNHTFYLRIFAKFSKYPIEHYLLSDRYANELILVLCSLLKQTAKCKFFLRLFRRKTNVPVSLKQD